MTTDLDENLISKDTPEVVQVNSYEFNSVNDKNAIGNYNIGTINAAKITAGTISSSVIYGGTINGTAITAGTISANIGYLGTLTASQINGGTLILGGTLNGNGLMQIKNSAGTVIVQGDRDGHHYYNTGGTELIRVNDTGLIGYGTVENVVIFQDSASGTTIYGNIGFSAGSQSFFVQSKASKNMYVLSSGTLILSDGAQTVLLSEKFYLTSNAAGTIQTAGKLELISTGSNDIVLNAGDDVNITAVDDVNISTGGDFILNGATKTAVIQTNSGYRELYCTESPEVWFMDFCDTKESIDPMFLEVTTAPYKFIKLDGDGYQVWGKRKGFENKRFDKVNKWDYITNNKFWSMSRPRKIV